MGVLLAEDREHPTILYLGSSWATVGSGKEVIFNDVGMLNRKGGESESFSNRFQIYSGLAYETETGEARNT